MKSRDHEDRTPYNTANCYQNKEVAKFLKSKVTREEKRPVFYLDVLNKI